MFFDFHCHPSFKTFLGHRLQEFRKDCWATLNFDLDFKILDSQSSLSQIKKGRGSLIVCALYGLESGFAGSGLIKLAAGLSPHAEKRFLQEIERGEWGYNQLMMGDWKHLMLSRNLSSEKSFRHLSSMVDYDPDSKQIQVILAAEGGHNFYDSDQLPGLHSGVIENLLFHKKPENPRLLYVTLTHLQQSVFCTHAYGMKLIKNPTFYPVGSGLNSLGKAFIRAALSQQNGKPIWIDVKHMSLRSRLEFYKLRAVEFPDAPIVATHMGITGVSYLKKPVKKVQTNLQTHGVEVFYYRSVGAMDTYFNPWSINLYDEDIQEIMRSGGLIGLSLDQRILGGGNVSKEIFSMEEFDPVEFQPIKKPNYHRLAVDHHNTAQKFRDWQIRYFCNNWLHAVKIGLEVIGDDAWNHLCIGSDFDGLIDPIDDFKSAAAYKLIFGRLVQWMPVVAQATGIPMAPDEVQQKVKGLVHDNAIQFLQQHYL
jgi:microsomal dipeptidase-like Zn-dependent dipeptidase